MRSSTLFIPALIASAVALAPPTYSASACPLEQWAELDIAVSDDGNLLVPARLGEEDVWMAMVTSSPFSLVWGPAVKRFDLKTQLLAGGGFEYGGRPVTLAAKLPLLSLGTYNYKQFHMSVAPSSGLSELKTHDGRPVIGQMGVRMLSGVDYELHLAERKLRLFSPKHCKNVGAYWADQYASAELRFDAFGTLFFPMELDGQLIETGLSPHRPATFIDPSITRAAYGFDDTTPGLETEALVNGRTAYRAMSLTTTGMKFDEARIHFGNASSECGMRKRKSSRLSDKSKPAIAYAACEGAAPFTLGRDVLNDLRVYVSAQDYKIYFTRSDVGAKGPPAVSR